MHGIIPHIYRGVQTTADDIMCWDIALHTTMAPGELYEEATSLINNRGK